MGKQVWKTEKEKELNPTILEYISGEDLELDKELVQYDIKVNKAHAKMLAEVGLISWKEYKKMEKALDELPENFELKPELEDVHMNIEAALGAAGKKLHTARSRNDQVMTDMALWMKDELAKTAKSVKGVQKVIGKKALEHVGLPMPAYTHMQPAVPTTFDAWLKAFSCLLEEDLGLIENIKEKLYCPLGACAVAGTSLPIDKEMTAKGLGFKKSFENPIATISSRGETETKCLFALSMIMLHLNKLANDLQLYSTFEFGTIELADEVCTSSSIMPQKKNPDALEVMHSKTAEVHSLLMQNLMILKGLPSSYQKDMQQTKKTVMQGFDVVVESLNVMEIIVGGIEPKKEKMKEIIEKSGCMATKEVDERVLQGVPFRDAYKKIRNKYINHLE